MAFRDDPRNGRAGQSSRWQALSDTDNSIDTLAESLCEAIQNCDIGKVQSLLLRRLPREVITTEVSGLHGERHLTALHYAVEQCGPDSIDILKLLLQVSLDKEELEFVAHGQIRRERQSKRGRSRPILEFEDYTPLCWACLSGNINAVRALLLVGADPNSQKSFDKTTPLIAVSSRTKEARSKQDLTNETRIVTALMNAGADVTLQDANGSTALHYLLAQEHQLATARLILAKAAKPINTSNKNGWTLLHCCVSYIWSEKVESCIRSVIKNNSSATEDKNKYNQTPLELATSIGNKEAIAVLQELPQAVVSSDRADAGRSRFGRLALLADPIDARPKSAAPDSSGKETTVDSSGRNPQNRRDYVEISEQQKPQYDQDLSPPNYSDSSEWDQHPLLSQGKAPTGTSQSNTQNGQPYHSTPYNPTFGQGSPAELQPVQSNSTKWNYLGAITRPFGIGLLDGGISTRSDASVSPFRNKSNERLQAADNSHTNAGRRLPLERRDQLPFRQGFRYADPLESFDPSMLAAAQVHEIQKPDKNGVPLHHHWYQSEANPITPKTISPKDAVLDFHENDEDASLPLFPTERRRRSASPVIIRRRSPSPEIEIIRRRSPSPEMERIRRRSPSPEIEIRRRRSPSSETEIIRRRSPSPEIRIRRRRSPSPEMRIRRRRSPSSETEIIRRRGSSPEIWIRRRRSPSPEMEIIRRRSPSPEIEIIRRRAPSPESKRRRSPSNDENGKSRLKSISPSRDDTTQASSFDKYEAPVSLLKHDSAHIFENWKMDYGPTLGFSFDHIKEKQAKHLLNLEKINPNNYTAALIRHAEAQLAIASGDYQAAYDLQAKVLDFCIVTQSPVNDRVLEAAILLTTTYLLQIGDDKQAGLVKSVLYATESTVLGGNPWIALRAFQELINKKCVSADGSIKDAPQFKKWRMIIVYGYTLHSIIPTAFHKTAIPKIFFDQDCDKALNFLLKKIVNKDPECNDLTIFNVPLYVGDILATFRNRGRLREIKILPDTLCGFLNILFFGGFSKEADEILNAIRIVERIAYLQPSQWELFPYLRLVLCSRGWVYKRGKKWVWS